MILSQISFFCGYIISWSAALYNTRVAGGPHSKYRHPTFRFSSVPCKILSWTAKNFLTITNKKIRIIFKNTDGTALVPVREGVSTFFVSFLLSGDREVANNWSAQYVTRLSTADHHCFYFSFYVTILRLIYLFSSSTAKRQQWLCMGN